MQALPKGDNFMLISSKGRYTLYVLVDLAKNGQNRYIPLKEIAERQNISKKYMEGILKTLVDRNLLEGVKGKGGGYKLTKEPKDYSQAYGRRPCVCSLHFKNSRTLQSYGIVSLTSYLATA